VKRSEYVDRLLNELISEISTLRLSIESEVAVATKFSSENERSFSSASVLIASQARFANVVGDQTGDSHSEVSDRGLQLVQSTVSKPFSYDVAVLHSQLDFLNQELEATRSLSADSRRSAEDSHSQLEVLRTQLLEARHDTVELRIQAAELVDSNRLNLGNRPSHLVPKAMSWEEQKLQLLNDFERESNSIDFNAMSPAEFESLFVATQRELADRDLLIEELKSMLDLQSQASVQGLAMGASAISQVLDTDTFIQEERLRLKELQDELQQKLRDAEIEISVERAKVARDRLSLENASQTFAEVSQAASASNLAAQDLLNFKSDASLERKLVPGSIPRTRRWLQRLGLRDDD